MYMRMLATLICSIALFCQTQIAFAQPAPVGYKPDAGLAKAVRNAKVINTSYPIRVMRSGKEVMVTTLNNPKSTDKSFKIDAVLVAKALMDADKTVLIVHYRTKESMRDPEVQAIVVKQSDVMAYGVNAIKADTLLDELRITKRSGKRAL